MRRRLNFENPEFFILKFKRKPKVWTIESIHELWMRVSERGNKQRNRLREVTNEIVSKIPKQGDSRYSKQVVYCSIPGSDKIKTYSFSYHHDFRSYGVSEDRLSFSTDKVKGREEKIDFLLNNELAFELGEKYQEAKRYTSDLQYVVEHILWEMIYDELRKKYKDEFPPNVIVVSISDRKYYVTVEDKYGYYLKFKWQMEVTNDVVKF